VESLPYGRNLRLKTRELDPNPWCECLEAIYEALNPDTKPLCRIFSTLIEMGQILTIRCNKDSSHGLIHGLGPKHVCDVQSWRLRGADSRTLVRWRWNVLISITLSVLIEIICPTFQFFFMEYGIMYQA